MQYGLPLCVLSIVRRRECENLWRRTQSEEHRTLYVKARDNSTDLIAATKTAYFRERLETADNSSMFRLVKSLEGRSPPVYPDSDSVTDSCRIFSDFFHDKIQKLRDRLDGVRDSLPAVQEVQRSQTVLDTFQPTTEEEIHKVMSIISKTCELDPLPARQLKQCLSPLAPVVARIVNASLSEGVVPVPLKEAIVRPLLKKPSLDKETLKNFRPVSNLPQLSKVLEKVVAWRLTDHLLSEGLFDPYQSAYRAFHSTETALVRVTNDIRVNMDKRCGTVLVLIDLSAAFDTIDHSVLLNRLAVRYGIRGTVLAWLRSYLQNRTQRVVIGDASSDSRLLSHGVPQGSVLGPLLFLLYVKPIGDILRKYGLHFHHYADDLQIYVSFDLNPASMLDAIRRVEACVAEIKNWMALNYLCMNDDKTEFLPVVPKSAAQLLDNLVIHIGGAVIPAATCVRNLGAYLDRHLDMKTQVSMTIKACYFHLRNISQISKYLPKITRERVVNALVTSRIDYCNSLLYGTVGDNFRRLQVLQNDAARLIFGQPRWTRASPLRMDLHWLPLQQRVDYKIALLVYKSLNDSAPVYLSELIQQHRPSRTLRSASKNLLVAPRTRVKAGDSSFAAAAAHVWNTLPASVKTSTTMDAFKGALKTHLYTLAYLSET